MPIPQAQQLIDKAQAGEKLSTKERRHCVAYVMSTMPEVTNSEMARWFQVTERAVRLDKKFIREEKAKLIKEDDIGLVIADIIMTYDSEVRDLQRSKGKARLGTREFKDHCIAIFDMRHKTVKALQDLGYLPKNIGTITKQSYEYKAIVDTRDGSVTTEKVEHLPEQKKLPAPAMEARDLGALEAEFMDLPKNGSDGPSVQNSETSNDNSGSAASQPDIAGSTPEAV